MTVIFDDSHGQDLRINTIGSYLKKHFGKKIIKLSVDGGFTCPNRDGTKGRGGCVFCSSKGSGEHAAFTGKAGSSERENDSVEDALLSQIELLRPKWPDAGYIPYFQSNTNTYAPVQRLKSIFDPAIAFPGSVGLAIATRPDCLSPDIIDLLSEYNRRTFLWVELGLQSIHDRTMKDMCLCYDLEDYDRASRELRERGIRTVTHLIMGLPGEDREMMLDSVRYVCRSPVFGLKLHMLNVVKDSRLPDLYPGYIPFGSIEEYSELIVDALEIIPSDITIHRIYGDAPRETLIAPTWARQKRLVLNSIHGSLRRRNTWQGRLYDVK